MRDIAIPNGLGAVGYDEGDVDDLVEGTLKQQRLLATAPREATEDDLGRDPAPLARAVVTAADLVAALRRATGSPTSTTRTLARALYSSDASLYRVVAAGRGPAAARRRAARGRSAVARDTGTPLTMRGAGTSIAGNAVGTGHRRRHLRHLNRVLAHRPRGAHRAASSPAPCTPTLQRAAAAARPAVRPRPVHAHPLHRSAG